MSLGLGFLLEYYDLVFDTAKYDDAFTSALGFAHIFKVKDGDKRIGIGNDPHKLTEALQRGAGVIAITDFSMDKTLLAKIKDNDAVLCIPLSVIEKSAHGSRPSLMYRAAALSRYALSKRIELSIASLADSRRYMLSYMQIIELAKLIGIDREKARECVSEANRKAGELLGKD